MTEETIPTPARPPARTPSVRERADLRWRSATRRLRALPDFLVLGGQRCGSTSLYTMLCGHPQVIAARYKEPHFFDRNHARGEGFYRRLFPLRAELRARSLRLGAAAVTGEATTYYLAHPAVPGRVAAMLPDVRLIAILRNPVARALSHHQLSVRGGWETLPFEQALAVEDERLEGEERRLSGEPGYAGHAHRYFSYRTRGLYLEQLERWWSAFPEDRLLVLRSEDLFADPGSVYRELTGFLGLAPDDRRAFEARNRVGYEAMEPATRESLEQFFREPNRRLEQRLGRALGW